MNFIDREVKTYLEKQFNIEPPKVSNTTNTNYYKLPYIGHFSKTTEQKLKKVVICIVKICHKKLFLHLLKLVIYLVQRCNSQTSEVLRCLQICVSKL